MLRGSAARHASVAVQLAQRGGFTGYRLCRRPLQNSMTRSSDALMLVKFVLHLCKDCNPRFLKADGDLLAQNANGIRTQLLAL